MMMPLNRTNTGIVGRWWWTVDRLILLMLAALMMFGLLLVMLGSPSVAERIGQGPMYFFHRQIIFVSASLIMIFFISLLNITHVFKLSVVGLIISGILMVVVLFHGEVVKGSSRWINFPGGSIQPSEFMKPCLVVVMAWLFSERYRRPGFRGWLWGSGICLLFVILLVMQPDIGMTAVVCAVWLGMFLREVKGLPHGNC